jgi:hypothetical protein
MLKRTRSVSALLCWRLVHALSAKGLATTTASDVLLKRGLFIATLERSKSSDAALWSTGAFSYVVVPDLPPVQKLRTLNDWKKLLQAYTSKKQQHAPAAADGILTVRSVAAQLYSRKQVTLYKHTMSLFMANAVMHSTHTVCSRFVAPCCALAGEG